MSAYTRVYFFVLGMYDDVYSVQWIAGRRTTRRTGCDNVRFRSENNGLRKWTATAAHYVCYVYIMSVCVRRPGAFKYIIMGTRYLHLEESEKLDGFDFFSSCL